MANKPGEKALLNIDDITEEPEFQMRVDGLNEDQVVSMVATIQDGGDLERVDIAEIKSIKKKVLISGFHRMEAYRRAKKKKIPALVQVLSLPDARLAATAANKEHDRAGLKRSHEDKRHALAFHYATLAEKKESWTDNRIAVWLGVSETFVRNHRPLRLNDVGKSEEIPLDDPLKRESADGRKFKAPAPKPATPAPKMELPSFASLDSDDWETVPLDEFLEADDFVWEALKRSRITTAGDLYKRIIAGETFSLPKNELLDLRKACEEVRDAPAEKPAPKPVEKKVGAEKGFNHREFDSAFGVVTRGIDEFGAVNPGEHMAAEKTQILKDLNSARKTWDLWVKRVSNKE